MSFLTAPPKSGTPQWFSGGWSFSFQFSLIFIFPAQPKSFALCTAKYLPQPSALTNKQKVAGMGSPDIFQECFPLRQASLRASKPLANTKAVLTGSCWIICLRIMRRASLWEQPGGGSPTKAQMWWTAAGSSSLRAYSFVSNWSWMETKSFVSKT